MSGTTTTTSDASRKPGPFESEMDSFDDDEFGGPLFGATTEQPAVGFDDDEARAAAASAPTTPARCRTGPIRRPARCRASTAAEAAPDPDRRTSTSGRRSPARRRPTTLRSRRRRTRPANCSWHDDPTVDDAPVAEAAPTSGSRAGHRGRPSRARREPARITIGTDPSGMPRRPDPKRRGAAPQRPPSARCGGPGGRWSQPARRRRVGARARRGVPGARRCGDRPAPWRSSRSRSVSPRSSTSPGSPTRATGPVIAVGVAGMRRRAAGCVLGG